jgi:hypothetical protein
VRGLLPRTGSKKEEKMGEGSTGTGSEEATALSEAATQGRGDGLASDQEAPGPARSAAIAAAGVNTGAEFASLMSALMSDVIEGRINPVVSNAAVNAGGKLLKIVEMEYRHNEGVIIPVSTPHPRPTIRLTG